MFAALQFGPDDKTQKRTLEIRTLTTNTRNKVHTKNTVTRRKTRNGNINDVTEQVRETFEN